MKILLHLITTICSSGVKWENNGKKLSSLSGDRRFAGAESCGKSGVEFAESTEKSQTDESDDYGDPVYSACRIFGPSGKI